MQRDFTNATLEELENICKGNDGSLWDAADDIVLNALNTLGVLKLYNSAATYRDDLVDMNNLSVSQIDAIFQAVKGVDDKYAGIYRGYTSDLRTFIHDLKVPTKGVRGQSAYKASDPVSYHVQEKPAAAFVASSQQGPAEQWASLVSWTPAAQSALIMEAPLMGASGVVAGIAAAPAGASTTSGASGLVSGLTSIGAALIDFSLGSGLAGAQALGNGLAGFQSDPAVCAIQDFKPLAPLRLLS